MALNGTHTKAYPNGGVYEGEFLRGKMHGTGAYTCPNGDRCASIPQSKAVHYCPQVLGAPALIPEHEIATDCASAGMKGSGVTTSSMAWESACGKPAKGFQFAACAFLAS